MTLFSRPIRQESPISAPAGESARRSEGGEPVSRVRENMRHMLRILILAVIPAAGAGVVAVLSPAEKRAAPERQTTPVEWFREKIDALVGVLPKDAQAFLGHDLRGEPTQEEQYMRAGEEFRDSQHAHEMIARAQRAYTLLADESSDSSALRGEMAFIASEPWFPGDLRAQASRIADECAAGGEAASADDATAAFLHEIHSMWNGGPRVSNFPNALSYVRAATGGDVSEEALLRALRESSIDLPALQDEADAHLSILLRQAVFHLGRGEEGAARWFIDRFCESRDSVTSLMPFSFRSGNPALLTGSAEEIFAFIH